MPSNNSPRARKQQALWQAVVDEVSLLPPENLGGKVKLLENGLEQGEDLIVALSRINPVFGLQHLRKLVPPKLLAKVSQGELTDQERNVLAKAGLEVLSVGDPFNQVHLRRPKNPPFPPSPPQPKPLNGGFKK